MGVRNVVEWGRAVWGKCVALTISQTSENKWGYKYFKILNFPRLRRWTPSNLESFPQQRKPESVMHSRVSKGAKYERLLTQTQTHPWFL